MTYSGFTATYADGSQTFFYRHGGPHGQLNVYRLNLAHLAAGKLRGVVTSVGEIETVTELPPGAIKINENQINPYHGLEAAGKLTGLPPAPAKVAEGNVAARAAVNPEQLAAPPKAPIKSRNKTTTNASNTDFKD